MFAIWHNVPTLFITYWNVHLAGGEGESLEMRESIERETSVLRSSFFVSLFPKMPKIAWFQQKFTFTGLLQLRVAGSAELLTVTCPSLREAENIADLVDGYCRLVNNSPTSIWTRKGDLQNKHFMHDSINSFLFHAAIGNKFKKIQSVQSGQNRRVNFSKILENVGKKIVFTVKSDIYCTVKERILLIQRSHWYPWNEPYNVKFHPGS